jgi:hypothetical protein
MAEDKATGSQPKLHIDSDWKAEAQKEKERLAKKEQAKPAKTPESADAHGAQELPEASFRSMVGMLASQAIMGLGAMADPQTNRIIIDLESARFSIDLLDILEQKTKGNLTEEESKDLTQVLAELRSRYVQISQLVARQMAAQQSGVATGAPGVATAGGRPVPPIRTDV